ncbi:MAG: tetratricopeptide repeat protein [Muribaculaceae bacterium]|nr:tetratricopeptide repeat protein [Muribaculaceae bacterium]
MKRIVIYILGILAAVNCYAASNIVTADSLYVSGNYTAAAELLSEIGQTKGFSSASLANLGNCYAKLGDYGHAMLCYNRSLLMDPSNKEVKHNISYVQSKVRANNITEIKGKKQSVDMDSPSFFSSVRMFITEKHLSDTWAVWGAVCFVLLIIAIALYIFSSSTLIRKIGFFGGLGLFGLTVIFLIFAFMGSAEMAKARTGVVIAYKVGLKTEPYSTAKASTASLTRGTLMTILDKEDENADSIVWYKVRLNSNYVGWIKDEDFEPVRNDKWLRSEKK